ncbi:hypothetical protein EBT16_03835 [bacterium]|nr:hypothetical protein [bacterium]
MSGSPKQKYPKVGIFLLVESIHGNWLWEVREKEVSLPFIEMVGGKSWRGAAEDLSSKLGLEFKSIALAGVGSGLGDLGESWVYSAFYLKASQEIEMKGFQWERPETCKDIHILSKEVKQAFLKLRPEVWVH